MISKNIFLILAAIICLIFPTDSSAQNRKFTGKKSGKTQISRKLIKNKLRRQQIVSGGVLNGKALNLVKPEFPASAKSVGAKGTVTVNVLIDENGDVVEAKAIRGNPLLIANSLKAARLSKFQPFILENGNILKVSGSIIYTYTSERLNWLEIGYAFSEKSYVSGASLASFLPFDFKEEKQLLAQVDSSLIEQQPEMLQTVSALIEGKLSSTNKSLWLFAVGREVGKLTKSYWDSRNESIEKIRILLLTIPENVSPSLKSSLENLLSSSNTYSRKYFENQTDLIERLYGLGN